MAEELKYEKESVATEEPGFLKAFKEQGVWTVSPVSTPVAVDVHGLSLLQIEDVEGNDEVTLTRKFGNEKWVYDMHSLTDMR